MFCSPRAAARRLVALLLLWLSASVAEVSAQGVEITVFCGNVGREVELCEDGAREWAHNTGNTVRFYYNRNNYDSTVNLIQRWFNEQSNIVDVLPLDLIWISSFSQHLLDLTPYTDPIDIHQHAAPSREYSLQNGRNVSIPWSLNFPLLYYRADLLERYNMRPPQTWDELTTAATLIQQWERERLGTDQFWGYIWDGLDYEGLLCNVLEWEASHRDDSQRNLSIRSWALSESLFSGLVMARDWIHESRISPEQVLQWDFNVTWEQFRNGNAVFIRNWTHVYSMRQDVSADSGIDIQAIPLPGSLRNYSNARGTLGGNHLVVSSYSEHPEEAVSLVLHLTDLGHQINRAAEGAIVPSIPRLYSYRVVEEHLNFLDGWSWREIDNYIVIRPATEWGSRYFIISDIVVSQLHEILAEDELNQDDIERQLRHLGARIRTGMSNL